jgi:uncharacterized protein YndB with AHSA1/START domain
MWFSMQQSDLSFIERAPDRLEAQAVCPAPPQRVFDVLADPSTWPRWFHDMRDAKWTSSSQACLGAVRVVSLGMGSFEERMIAWEPGKRFSFSIDGASVPLAKRVVEDWQLSSTDEGHTKLDWAMLVDPSLLSRALRPAIQPLMQRMFNKSIAGLTRFLS